MRPSLSLGSLALSLVAIAVGCGGGDDEKKRLDPSTLGQAGATGVAGKPAATGGSAGKAGKAGGGGASAGGASAGGTSAGGASGGGSGGASAGSGGASAGSGGASGGSGGASAGKAGSSGSSGGAPYVGPDGNGTVVVIDDGAFTPGGLFGETATVTADASDPSKPPSAMWSGTGKFSLTGVAVGEHVWFSVLPTKAPSAYLKTLSSQTVPADGVSDLGVPVMKGAALEAATGGPLDPALGYVVLVIRAPSGDPVSGATVTPQGSAKVFYDMGSGFSSSAAGTGAKGLAVVPDAAPGAAAVFNVKGTTAGAEGPVKVDLDQTVRVEPKAVTLVSVNLAP